ncbi:hypothetical protein [Stenotrophomonas sp. AB1(2024)]|uniref:hypothetical protein n=1 Tax=Stenotrophomonas sp. AB1(2024) TaxID=3132215 RepID=UPI0030B2894B
MNTKISDAAPICETCNGCGLIGGPSFYAPDEGGVPCPDCQTTRPRLAAPPAQGIDLGQHLLNLVAAAKYMRDRVVETRGTKCMDDLDYAIDEADKALIDSQRDAAPGAGS